MRTCGGVNESGIASAVRGLDFDVVLSHL
jgi:hypothetical protein